MRVWSEILFIVSNLGRVSLEEDKSCSGTKRKKNRARLRTREQRGGLVMVWSTLLRMISSIVFVFLRRFNLVRKKV